MNEASTIDFILSALLFYLIGSIPTSYLIGKAKGIDIRKRGSGNVGATNVGRLLGLRYYILALALDISKGVVSAALAGVWKVPIYLAALAVIGHNWSIFLMFSGGKGVATTLGVLAVTSFPSALITALIWALIVKATRYVSVGSMAALLIVPLVLFLFGKNPEVIFTFLALGILTIWRHRGNIALLLQGAERRLGTRPQDKE
jgi:glycerol-3-phosphate acyltransferase PlsY